MEPEHHHDHIVAITGILIAIVGLIIWMYTYSTTVSLYAFIFAALGVLITLISINQIENRREMHNTRTILLKGMEK